MFATSATSCGNGAAVNHKQAGVLAWVIGDRSGATFKPLWEIVKCWHCFFYVTDGWKVYPMFIEAGDQIVSKTANRAGGNLQLASGGCAYMTRVEAACRRAEYSGSRSALEKTLVCGIT